MADKVSPTPNRLVTDEKRYDEIIVEETGAVPGEVFTAGDSFYAKYQRFVGQFGVEQRGIEPVPEDERTDRYTIKPGAIFFSANLVVTCFAIGAIGVTVFGLGWVDGFLTILMSNLLSALPVAYFVTFGPVFGMRQMVFTRYSFGYYGAKVVALLNGVSGTCWSALNVMVGAQLLHAVNREIPGYGGILIIATCAFIVSSFGYRMVHIYEMYMWIPVLIIFLVVLGEFAASGNFENIPMGRGETEAAGVLSFMSAIFGSTLGWAPYASDYSCYQPRNANRTRIFVFTYIGLATSTVFLMSLGLAVATATVHNIDYQTAYKEGSVGALLAEVLLRRLGGFGRFCLVVLSLSVIAVNVPTTYSVCFSLQVLSRYTQIVPRSLLVVACTIAYCGIAIPGYTYFESVLTNFMLCTSYWIAIYVAVCLIEHHLFRRGFSGYAQIAYNQPKKLPSSIAALCAFAFGIMGAVLGMAQVYFIGPIGKRIGGEYGCDLGFVMAFALTAVTFIPFRYLEIKHFGR